MVKTIGNPLSWSVEALAAAGSHAARTTGAFAGDRSGAMPVVRRIGVEDIAEALKAGIDDFVALRSDVMVLCLLYPAMGVVLVWLALSNSLIPLLFPLFGGFALLGPVAAVGLYEMSRRRERGEPAGWSAAFGVIGQPSFGAIFVLGLVLAFLFAFWLVVAGWIHSATMGGAAPADLVSFAERVLTTPAGWAMIVIGIGVGFVFAALVLAISITSFPLLLDRDVGLPVAVLTSVEVARRNPVTVAIWGAIVAAGLVIGSIPALLGLIVILPILGHATWHLYRRAVG